MIPKCVEPSVPYRCWNTLLEGDVSVQTKNLLEQRLLEQQQTAPLMKDPARGLATIAGILLGSPEFQRR
jgi:hypothetical protein